MNNKGVFSYSTAAFLFLLLVLCGSGSGSASGTTDSLVYSGRTLYSNEQYSAAERLFRQAIALDDSCAQAFYGLARIAISQDSIDSARVLLNHAHELSPESGYDDFLEGVLLHRDDSRFWATKAYKSAFRSNRAFSDAILEAGILESQGLISQLTADRTMKKAIEEEPQHPSAYYVLGRYYDDQLRPENALRYYRAQLRVNPLHPLCIRDLGYLLLDRGEYQAAADTMYYGLTNTTGHAHEFALGLGGAYMGQRQFQMAQEAYVNALTLMSNEERTIYDNISPVATPQQNTEFNNLSPGEQVAFQRRFWLQRDPTPVTPMNERLLEHLRRIAYARRKYSRAREPYDDRGIMYIRYGEPEYKSSSVAPNFSAPIEVMQIKERYLRNIYGPRVPVELDRPGMPTYPLVDPVEILGSREMTGRSVTGGDSPNSGDSTANEPTSGIDLYGTSRWEEWIYTSVGRGLLITFYDRMSNGELAFAEPPVTSSGEWLHTLQVTAPREAVAIARTSTPERYYYDEKREPLGFHYYLAQFRAGNSQTLVDIYYGYPLNQLQFVEDSASHGFRARIENGIVVYDQNWNIRGRVSDITEVRSTERPAETVGSLHVDRKAMTLPGGADLIVALQARDLAADRLQVYQENLHVTRYDTTTLAMSDIVLAAGITSVDSTENPAVIRNGLSILPIASKTFSRTQQAHVYFEVYNLTRGPAFGETQYEIGHEIRHWEEEEERGFLRNLLRFFKGSGPTVGVSRVLEGLRSSEYYHFTLDTSNLTPGVYTLRINTTDLKSGETVFREQSFAVAE